MLRADRKNWKRIVLAVAVLWVLVTLALVATTRLYRANATIGEYQANSVSSRLGPFLEVLAGKEFYNELVFLNNVQVAAGPRKNIIYVVGQHGTRILVIATSTPTLESKAVVDVKGVLRRPPTESTMREQWKLSSAEAERVHKQGVYILAQSIVPDHDREGQ